MNISELIAGEIGKAAGAGQLAGQEEADFMAAMSTELAKELNRWFVTAERVKVRPEVVAHTLRGLANVADAVITAVRERE